MHPISSHTISYPKLVLVLLAGLVYIGNGTSYLTSHFAAVFYEGSSLPSIFSSFLSIPSISQPLGPLSYSSMASVVDPPDTRGSGQLFGASALNGPPEEYLNAYRHYKNLSMNIIPSGQALVNTLAFSPIPKSQIKASRKRGGNVIDPPLESYVAVQLQTQFAEGVMEVPDVVEKGRQLFFKQ